MNKLTFKLIYCFIIMFCYSTITKAQQPIKNSALVGEWKLISTKSVSDFYSYDCEEKKFKISDAFYFRLGESKTDLLEKKVIKDAEKSFFKVKANGEYELKLGSYNVEKGSWISKLVEESEEGYIPDTFGYLVTTSDSEPFDNIVEVQEKQLLIVFEIDPEEGIHSEFIFRKDFKGNAFK